MQPSIYDTIGAAAPGDAAVDISYDKAWSDPDLGGYFSNVDRGKLKGHPRTSSRPRSAAPMLTKAARWTRLTTDAASPTAFDKVVQHLAETLAELGVPVDTIAQIATTLARSRGSSQRPWRHVHSREPSRPRDDRAREHPMRVVVADDQALMREGVARLLEDAQLEVVALAADGADLLRKVRAHKPDVAVVDIRMPPTHVDDGLTVAAIIRAELPATRVLVLSQYVEELYATRLLADAPRGSATASRIGAGGPGLR